MDKESSEEKYEQDRVQNGEIKEQFKRHAGLDNCEMQPKKRKQIQIN
jgi:hypothetical protein